MVATPSLSQGIGNAEHLLHRLHAAEIKEPCAEDFHTPRTEEDAFQSLLEEYQRSRNELVELHRRVSATREYTAYDKEMCRELGYLDARFHMDIEEGKFSVTKFRYKWYQNMRHELIEKIRDKHHATLVPVIQSIEARHQAELDAGRLKPVSNEDADAYFEEMIKTRDDRSYSEEVEQSLIDSIKGEQPSQKLIAQQTYIDETFLPEEEEKQKEMAFVKIKRKGQEDQGDGPDFRLRR